MPDDAGRVVAATGAVDPDRLGPVLPHEHVFIDLVEAWFELPDSAVDRRLAREPVSLENLSHIRRNPLGNRDNARLDAVDEAIEEIARFAQAGGGTIVDVTPKHTGGDPERVRSVCRAAGVHLVHGTAYYTKPAHPPGLTEPPIDELADEFVADVRDGIDDTDVRAGLIGEIGLSGRMHEAEQHVLRAGARAAVRTGAPLSVHPPGATPEANEGGAFPTSRWALLVLDIVEEEGLAPERVVMSHMDRTRLEFTPDALAYQRQVADRGAYLEYDLWGTEFSRDEFGTEWPSDAERLDVVSELVADGYVDQLLFSHDICMKAQQTAYGGFGYAHLLEHIVPRLRAAGFTDQQLDAVLVDNPQRMLTFVA